MLRILFYGQSISVRKWTDQAMATLRARYPYVTFDYRNLALGGWSSKLLARAVDRDMREAYPDLVVFHVYGDHKAYEEIIRTIRSRTAAEVIVQTDHVVTPVEPLCPTGLHLQWSPPPGCTGHGYFKQRHWEDFMSGLWIPTMAAKYDMAIEPRRNQWDAYLRTHDLQPRALIADGPHPNARGWTLMANLFTTWFERVVDAGANVGPSALVQELPLPKPGVRTRFSFTGNRVEFLGDGPLAGKIEVRVDGKAPQAIDGCWQDSRVSALPNIPEWPALKQVGVAAGYHASDVFTLRLDRLNPDQSGFDFALNSMQKGALGSGKADAPFASPAGLVTIAPEDWNLAYARQVSGKPVPNGVTFTWRHHFVCTDQPPVLLANGRRQQRFLLVTGLENARHIVDIMLAEDAPAVSEARAYRPPVIN